MLEEAGAVVELVDPVVTPVAARWEA